MSAAIVAARRTIAPPVSLLRKSRTGAARLRTHAVRARSGAGPAVAGSGVTLLVWRALSAGRAEALGSDVLGREAQLHRQARRGLHEAVAAADEHRRAVAGHAGLRDQLTVDVAGVAAPAVGRVARIGEDRVALEFVGEDHVVGFAHRVDEPHRRLRQRTAAVA